MVQNKHSEFDKLFAIWNEHGSTLEGFTAHLVRQGWSKLFPTGFKCVYGKDHRVLKFDANFNHLATSHTAAEARQYSRARPAKKRHLARTIAYRCGLLMQERVGLCVSREDKCPCRPAMLLARRLRIGDWENHGLRNGRIVFFDSDSHGSGWWNWKRQRHGMKMGANERALKRRAPSG